MSIFAKHTHAMIKQAYTVSVVQVSTILFGTLFDCACKMGLHRDVNQSSFQAGLVAMASWAHPQTVLEVAVVAAVTEAIVHELSFSDEVSSCQIYAQSL